MDYASVSPDKQALAKALDERIGQASARAHVALAAVSQAAAEFDQIGGWCAPGIRSLPHWLSINAGFDAHTGSELLRVGTALKVLPGIAQAFNTGQLSFDKVRQVTTVATSATEEMFLEIARGASGSQLERICRSMRRIANAEAHGHDQKQQAERGLWTVWDEDGMMRLTAKLPSEDAAIVMKAIESITGGRPLPERSGSEVQDPAEEPWAARRADALVAMCENVLAGDAKELVSSGATRQVFVHVDAGVLSGATPGGRSYIEGGAAVSADTARRIACDSEVIVVTQRDGLPIDVGRKKRIPPDRLRRALEVRDRFCRFPGCGVPADRAQAHHLQHWSDGGPTDRDNLILLCNFHHHRLHDGGYVIRMSATGLVFETHDGHVIGARELNPVTGKADPVFHHETARAEWGGEAMDFDHTMFVLAQNSQLAEARAAPP